MPKVNRNKVNVSFPEQTDAPELLVEDWNAIFWRAKVKASKDTVAVAWSFPVYGGKLSTDFPVLLEGFRKTIASVVSPKGVGGIRLKLGSLSTLSTCLRDVFRWMVLRDIDSFAKFDRRAVKMFVSELPHMLVDRDGFFKINYESTDEIDFSSDGSELDEPNGFNKQEEISSCADNFGTDAPYPSVQFFDVEEMENGQEDESEEGQDAQDGQEEDEVTYSQVFGRLQLVQILYLARSRLSEAGLAPMPQAPFGSSTLTETCKSVTRFVAAITPPLPDEVALPVLREVLDWLYCYSSDVMRLLSAYLQIRHDGGSPLDQKAARVRLLTTFNFQTVESKGVPWHTSFVEQGGGIQGLGWSGALTYPGWVIRDFVEGLKGACISALLLFCGLRPSEVCSLKFGARSKTNLELPSCVSIEFSKDGLLELFFVHGTVYKGRREAGDAAIWLIGCRPAGSNWVPPSLKALMLLDELRAHWPVEVGEGALLLAGRAPKGLPGLRSGLYGMSTQAMRFCQQRFIEKYVDLSELPDLSRYDESLVEYRNSRGTNITSRHTRKTFSAFMLETKSSSVEMVRMHFKHLDSAVTLASYFPPVHRLRQQGSTEAYAASVQFFTGILQGRKVLGALAPLIEKYFKRKSFAGKSTSEIYQAVSTVVRLHRIRVFFSDHGACLIRLNPVESRCRSVSSEKTSGWLWDAPNLAVRTPGLCSGCNCFVMDSSHIPFWRERAASSIGFRQDERVHRVQLYRARAASAIVKAFERGPGTEQCGGIPDGQK